mmetsp:Transcript_68653/g.147068  ORF Transcript_68653/g.147068 Transcript_68653/m.147068 type:complete len:238 (-) Transcript_68653:2765-3478(-)
MLTTEVDRLVVLVRHRQQVHGLVVLAVLHEKLSALGEDLGVAVSAQVVRYLPQGIEEARGEAELQGALLTAGLLVEVDGLGVLIALLVVLRGLHHICRIRRQSETHEVAVEVVLLRQAHRVRDPARHLEEVDRLLYSRVRLQVPCQVIASRCILRLLADLLGLIEVLVEASHAAKAEPIASLLVLAFSPRQVRLRLQVLRIPTVKVRVLALLDVGLEILGHAQGTEEARRLGPIGSG